MATFPAQPASLACTVNENVPTAVGLPLITPPDGSVAVAIVSGSGATTTVTGTSAVRLTLTSIVRNATYESRACTTAVNNPNAVGMPEIVPPASIVSPGGSWPDAMDHSRVPTRPDAEALSEYGEPTTPAGTAGTDTLNSGATISSDTVAVAVLPGHFASFT